MEMVFQKDPFQCAQNHLGFWAAMHPAWCMADSGIETRNGRTNPGSSIQNSYFPSFILLSCLNASFSVRDEFR